MSHTVSHYILVIIRKIKSWICERGGKFSSTSFEVRIKEQVDTSNHHIFILFTEAQKRNLSWLTLHGKGPTPMCVCVHVCVCVLGWDGLLCYHQAVLGQSLSHVWLFVTPWTAAHHTSLSITNSQSLLKLMPIESVMPFNHLILCCPLLLLPSIFPSIRVFSNESVVHIRWPKYWSFNFSISPSNEYTGLISFRID